MSSAALGASGGSQPHDNMMPFLGIHFIISLFGIFPSQT
jgi:microcystin-dependent protein